MHIEGFARIIYIYSLGLDNVGLERGNVMLNQPTRQGWQAARLCQSERAAGNQAHLGTLHYSRTPFSHEASHP